MHTHTYSKQLLAICKFVEIYQNRHWNYANWLQYSKIAQMQSLIRRRRWHQFQHWSENSHIYDFFNRLTSISKKRNKNHTRICFTHSCRISQLHSILGHSHQTIHTGTYEWPHQYSQYTSRGCGRTTLPRNTRRRPPSNPLPNSLSHLHDCLPGLQIEQLHCHVVMEESKVIHKIPEQEQAR